MRLMTYNILEGGEGRVDPLAETVRLAGADVVVVQEAWDRELFQRLADRLHMDCFLAEHPTNAQGHCGLLSRWRIREAVNHAGVRSGGEARLSRAVFHAVVESGGVTLPVIGVHLHAGELWENEERRLEELEEVLEIGGIFSGMPHVIAGDFNSSHPQQVIDESKVRPATRERVGRQGNEFPRKVVRAMLEAGYVDAHALHHAGKELGRSFTTAHPAMRVDYIFVSPDLCPQVRSCDVFTPSIGRYASDHYPVVAELAF